MRLVGIDVGPEVCHASLVGDLDVAAALRVHGLVRELLGAPCPVVELDLREVRFVDCAGIGLLVTAAKLVRHAGRSLRIRVTADGPVTRLVRRLEMDSFFASHLVIDSAHDGNHSDAASDQRLA